MSEETKTAEEQTAAASEETTDAPAEVEEVTQAPVAEAVASDEAADEADTAAEADESDPEATGDGAESTSEDDAAAAAEDSGEPAAAAAEETSADDVEAAASEAPPESEEAPATQYDFETLHAMNVHELQEIASGVDHDAVHGYTTMHKDDLVNALCEALDIEAHVHHEVVGIDKFAVKAKINALKVERDEAFADGDRERVKQIRRRIHNLKHRLRKATV